MPSELARRIAERIENDTLPTAAIIDAELVTVRNALIDVTPSHRVAGECWCGQGWSIQENGRHSQRCKNAQAALASLKVQP